MHLVGDAVPYAEHVLEYGSSDIRSQHLTWWHGKMSRKLDSILLDTRLDANISDVN